MDLVTGQPATSKLIQFPVDKEIKRQLIMAKTNLILNHPFFGALTSRLNFIQDNSQPTAWTDGKSLGYNSEYIRALTMRQKEGLLAHEVMHCALGHCWRRDARHPMKWNYACDFAIDPMLVAEGFDVPDQTINPEWKGFSAERIYELLPDPPELVVIVTTAGGKGGAGSKQQLKPRDGYGCGGVKDAPTTGGVSQIEWKTAVAAAADVAKSQGKLPANLQHLVEELEKPEIDWRATLRRFVQVTAQADYSWMRPSRRAAALDLTLPSLYSEQVPPVVVAIDTSGSISDRELVAFLSETQSIIDEVHPEITYLIQCDAAVHSVDEFLADDILKGIKIHGRGGTSFVPVFETVKELGINAACLIYLTDMYGTFPSEEPDYPVLWVSTTENYLAPIGETIFLSDGGGAPHE